MELSPALRLSLSLRKSASARNAYRPDAFGIEAKSLGITVRNTTVQNASTQGSF